MSVAFFFAMAWKSALISALALCLVLLLRSRAAAERTALLRVAICLLLLLPLAAAMMPAIPLTAAREVPALLLPASGPVAAVADGALAAAVAPEPSVWDDPSELVLLLYLGGLAMVAGRLAAGLWTLRRWTREADPVLHSGWTEALARAEDGRAGDIRLLVSTEAESPLSWGWRRPVILIDRDTYSMPEEADSVLAHEMAHIGRGDWLTLMLARLAVALFWFNPLVWLIERTVMEEAEQAADREAISRIDPARYAQTLLTFAALGKGNPLPANSITSGSLSRRVRAILDGGVAAAPRMSVLTLASMGASVAVAAPIGALQLVAPSQPAASPRIAEVAVAPSSVAEPARLPPPQQALELPEPSAAPAAPAVAIAARAADGTLAAAPPVPPPAPRVVIVSPPTPPAPPAPPAFAWTDPRVMVQFKLRQASDHFENLGAMATAAVEAELAAERVDIRAEQRRAFVIGRTAQRAAMRAQREAAMVQARNAARNVTLSMEASARGLDRGADGLERGGRKMAEQADKLSRRDYREQQIARAAIEGRRLTHEHLLEIAENLREGAEDMTESAQEMREQAEKMRQKCLEQS